MNRILNFFLLFVSVILLIFIIYKSEFYWGGINRLSYIPHYIALIFTIILCLKISSFKKNSQIIILTSIYTIILSALSFEAYISINKKHGKDKDTLKFLYNEKKKINKRISIVSSAIFFEKNLVKKTLPLAGKSLSETIHCKENDFFSIYNSDRYGFNNPDYEWDSDTINYLLIGDSYVHGACVNRPNDFGSIFRKLSGKSVLSLGWDGNGPLLEYATLKEYFKKGTKNLLWFYYEQNDLDNLAFELQNDILKNYLKNDEFLQNLKSKQGEIDQIIDKAIENHFIPKDEKNNFDFLKFIKLTKTRAMLSKNVNIYKFANKKKPQNEFSKILEKLILFTKENEVNLYFIYLPTFEKYEYDLTFNKNEIIRLVKQFKINFIDIDQEVFQKQTDPKNLFVNSKSNHYNENGYLLISKKIYEIIKYENK